MELVTANEIEIHRPVQILVAEDDETDQELIEQAVREVCTKSALQFVANGKELVELLETLPEDQSPSLIILDYNMPLLNGLETLRALKANERYSDIPKVIYSTSFYKKYEEDCLAENACAYIKKGITMNEMKENISEMLKYCRA